MRHAIEVRREMLPEVLMASVRRRRQLGKLEAVCCAQCTAGTSDSIDGAAEELRKEFRLSGVLGLVSD